mgnify:CR=1 FL=1
MNKDEILAKSRKENEGKNTVIDADNLEYISSAGLRVILKLRKENMKLSPKIFGPTLALGISPFIMVSTESLLSISFTTSLAKYGGDVAVGAMTIITSINMLVTMPLQGFTQGGQPIMSYNYGAKNVDRVKKAFRLELIICASYATIFWAMPSDIAVFPTPGSPTNIGLFLVLLLRIWRTLLISSSLPMTGSSFPCAALSLRLTANLLRFSNLFSAIYSVRFKVHANFGDGRMHNKPSIPKNRRL